MEEKRERRARAQSELEEMMMARESEVQRNKGDSYVADANGNQNNAVLF